jgi:hypothetical protein
MYAFSLKIGPSIGWLRWQTLTTAPNDREKGLYYKNMKLILVLLSKDCRNMKLSLLYSVSMLL